MIRSLAHALCIASGLSLAWPTQAGAQAAPPAASPPAPGAAPQAPQALAYDDVRADMTELVSAIAELHPNPFWSRSREQIEHDADDIAEQARTRAFSRRDYYRRVAALIVSLDDPHCWVFVPGWREHVVDGHGTLMPLSLTFRDGKATVRSAPSSAALPVGASILSINDLPMTDLYREFRPLTGQADDPYGDEFLSTYFARFLWFFHDAAGPFTIRFADAGGEHSVSVPGFTIAELDAAQSSNAGPVPLSLTIQKDGAALINFRACVEPEKIRALAEPIFQRLKNEHVSTLVIDARDNSGGTDGAWITLLEFLTSKPFSAYAGSAFPVTQRLKDMLGREGFERGYSPATWDTPSGTRIESKLTPEDLVKPDDNPLRFDGNWSVISGRGTFSSGMSFVCAVKAYHLAPVVGEETGGRVKGFGQWVRVKLPRTGLEIALSTKQFDGAVDVPLRRGVPPDLQATCPPTIPTDSDADPALLAAIKAAQGAPHK